MTTHTLPDTIHSETDFSRLLATAIRKETPCGPGKLVWRIWGHGGKPVVLLHGGSGSWAHWVRNIDPLVKAGYSVYAPDLPGFGESDIAPVNFDADGQADWVAQGIGQLLETASYDLVGFSFGSMVATFIAVQCPARVSRLVVIGAPALTNVPGPRPHLRNWRGLGSAADRYQAHKHNLRSLMLAHDESVHDDIVAQYGRDAENDRIPQRRLFTTDIMRQILPDVRCPVWGIWGAEDALYQGCEATIVPALSRAPLFQGLTRIPSAGHWVQYEAAALFNRHLLAILDADLHSGAKKN